LPKIQLLTEYFTAVLLLTYTGYVLEPTVLAGSQVVLTLTWEHHAAPYASYREYASRRVLWTPGAPGISSDRAASGKQRRSGMVQDDTPIKGDPALGGLCGRDENVATIGPTGDITTVRGGEAWPANRWQASTSSTMTAS
jgi:hypothetical protein